MLSSDLEFSHYSNNKNLAFILQSNHIKAISNSISNTFSSTLEQLIYSSSSHIQLGATMIDSNPPLLHQYGALVRKSAEPQKAKKFSHQKHPVVDACSLPLIDLNGLKSSNEGERLACTVAICKAASEWGFFQVINHGINLELLRNMREEQMKLFEVPFERKVTSGLLNNPYSWGTPTATSANHFSWSESFHIPLTMISEAASWGEFNSLRYKVLDFFDIVCLAENFLFLLLLDNNSKP